MKINLIAPCGMNCNLCLANLREKNTCPGCRISKKEKSISRDKCKIKKCQKKSNIVLNVIFFHALA